MFTLLKGKTPKPSINYPARPLAIFSGAQIRSNCKLYRRKGTGHMKVSPVGFPFSLAQALLPHDSSAECHDYLHRYRH